MALTGWSNNTNYLFRNAAFLSGAVGWYCSAWCYRATGTSANGWIFAQHETTAHRSLYADTSDQAPNVEVSGGAFRPTGAHANAAWFHVGGMILTASSRKAYRDAATPATQSATDTTTTPTTTKIGVHGPGGNNNAWSNTGALAEISVWDVRTFSVANVDSLDAKLYNGGAGGAGGNPININAESAQPWTGKLLAYWIDSANTITDLSGNGNNLTMQGTLTNFATGHPNIEAV